MVLTKSSEHCCGRDCGKLIRESRGHRQIRVPTLFEAWVMSQSPSACSAGHVHAFADSSSTSVKAAGRRRAFGCWRVRSRKQTPWLRRLECESGVAASESRRSTSARCSGSPTLRPRCQSLVDPCPRLAVFWNSGRALLNGRSRFPFSYSEANVVVGGQITQIVFGERIEPLQTPGRPHSSQRE